VDLLKTTDSLMIGQFQMATIAKTPKAVNYTPEQTALATSQYIAGVSVEQIALALGKSARSIVAKLSRELKGTEHEYKAKTYATKTGETVVKKDELADKIGAMLGATEPEIESLTKVNKTMLKKIMDALPATEIE
jgi:hypothetical protein